MSGATLGHLLRRAGRSLRENLWLNAISALVIAVALVLVGGALVVGRHLDRLVETWGQDVHISAYFAEGTPSEVREALRADLAGRAEVREVVLVSEAEAAAWMRQRSPELAPVLDDLGENALPASLEIELRPELAAQPGAIAAFAAAIARPELSAVDYGAAWTARFQAFLSLLSLVGGFLGVLIVGTALFVVVNTVNLIVYSRRDEVEIEKLVGATPAWMAAPVVVEGVAQGLAGAVLAGIGLRVAHRVLAGALEQALALDPAAALDPLPPGLLGVLALSGAVIGGLASAIAVLRFAARAP